jgi:hypothetical protein
MVTRRQLLSTAISGSAAFVAGAGVAHALSEQPMPPDVASAYALRCGGDNSGHNELIQAMRAMLKSEVAQGIKPADAQEVVVCPLCSCRMVVAAD